MSNADTVRTVAVASSVAVLLLAASLWLWAKYGTGVYFDAIMGALAGCF